MTIEAVVSNARLSATLVIKDDMADTVESMTVRLQKKRGGFGMSISDDKAEVVKLLQEQDGSDGPAAEQGVRIGMCVVAVVRSHLLRSAERRASSTVLVLYRARMTPRVRHLTLFARDRTVRRCTARKM